MSDPSTPDPRDVAFEQALQYAKELSALYRMNQASAEDVHLAQEASARIDALLTDSPIQSVFQPIKDIRSGRTAGLEALSRFEAMPNRTPDVWLAEAEAVGRLEELDLKAAHAALDHFADVPEDTYLSLNLSPRTALRPEFVALAARAPADRVVLEITEHAPVENYEDLANSLREFRRAGGRLAVDDAGAGFASLRHILRLAPDIIKLDISLTRGIDIDPARRALARALISFAYEMRAVIVAEGVETESELIALRSLGVFHAQGFYLGRPGPLEPVEAERRTRPRTLAS